MEGYGQTEASAGITFSIAGDPSTGYTVFILLNLIYTKFNFDCTLYISFQMDNLTLLIQEIVFTLLKTSCFTHTLSLLKVLV